MGKLITVVGNSGVGKTTFTSKLCEIGSFTPFLEITEDKPFLQKFHDNRNEFCFANQVDFLLYQAEREKLVKENDMVGVLDGGLDECFHVFTKRFHQKDYLDDEEFLLCERLYSILRLLLPSPDLIIILTAPDKLIAERMRKRGRDIDIERSQDLIELKKLIEKWLAKNTSVPTIYIDASQEDPTYSSIIEGLVKDIKIRLNI